MTAYYFGLTRPVMYFKNTCIIPVVLTRLKGHSHTIWDKTYCSVLGLIINGFDTNIRNNVTYKSVDKEKIKIIMICAHPQCKQKQTKILKNRTCWPQVKKIRSASKALFHFWYIISFICSTSMSKHCKKKQHFTFSLNA